MWKKKIVAPVFFLLFISIFSILTTASIITDCSAISSSGIYILTNDISATTTPNADDSCIFIGASNVTLELGDHIITNNNHSIIYGINSVMAENITIIGGTIQNFNNVSTNIGVSIDYTINTVIKNTKSLNNSINFFLGNINYSNVQIVSINPYFDIGVWVFNSRNNTFSVFSQSKTYAGYFHQIYNSSVNGYFDTAVLIPNQNWWTNFESTITGNENYTYKTSLGIGLFVNTSINSVYRNIQASGLIQGLALEDSNFNIFTQIVLPQSQIHGTGFGVLFLGLKSFNNTFCEITGGIYDNCNNNWVEIDLSKQPCRYKNNTLLSSCYYLNHTVTTKLTMNQLFLTSLIPINVPEYPFLSFLFTPFFLLTMFVCGISAYIVIQTHNVKFGEYILTIGVFGLCLVSFYTMIFGIIFVFIMSWIIIKQHGGGQTENK